MPKTERLPWFKCFPKELLGALAGLPPDEGYIYVIALLRIYETGGPISDDAATLARRSGFGPTRTEKVLGILIEKNKLQRLPDGRLLNAKAAEEIDSAVKKVSTSSKKLSDAAKKRWQKVKQNQTQADASCTALAMKNKSIEEERDSSFFVRTKKDANAVDLEADYFKRGKEVLGQSSGGLLAKLLKAKKNPALARAAVESASVRQNPREYIGAIIRGQNTTPEQQGWDLGI